MQERQGGDLKLMASAFKTGNVDKGLQHKEYLKQIKKREDLMRDVRTASADHHGASSSTDLIGLKDSPLRLDHNSTEYGHGYSVSKPFGVGQRKSNQRRRPYIKKRKEQKSGSTGILHEFYGEKEGDKRAGSKRSASGAGFEDHKAAWCKESRVIPIEGSPKSQ